MENKQTAVEWLINKTESLISIETFQEWQKLKEQAIGIEKEQMEECYTEGLKRMSYIRSLVDGLMVPDENPVPDDFDTFYKNKYGRKTDSN